MNGAEIAQRVWFVRGGLQRDVSFTPASGDAWFSYQGPFKYPFTPKHIKLEIWNPGSGAQTSAEVGIFSSTTAPNKSGLTLTKIVSTLGMDSLTQVRNTPVANSSVFSTVIKPGHIWVGVRIVMATSQPALVNLTGDGGLGYCQTFAGAGTFASTNSYACTIPAVASLVTGIGPAMWLTAD